MATRSRHAPVSDRRDVDRPETRDARRDRLGRRVRAWSSLLVWAARVILGGVWIWAGLAKLSDADAAVRAVRAYRILPEVLVKPFAWGLPMVEIALGVLLIVGLGSRIAAGISGVVLIVFIAGIASVWARGLQIDCGCFGGGG